MLKKYCYYLVLILINISNPFAQSQDEAKAAYLLAEEFYAKGDYSNTLKFLDITESNLGSTNCKILYLKILTLSEVGKKEDNMEARLKAISQFEQSQDYPDFNAEKRLEVSKIKLLLIEAYKLRLAKKDSLAEEVKNLEESTRNFYPLASKLFEGLPVIGSSSEELQYLVRNGSLKKTKGSLEDGLFYFWNDDTYEKSASIRLNRILGYKFCYFAKEGYASNAHEKRDEILKFIEQELGMKAELYVFNDSPSLYSSEYKWILNEQKSVKVTFRTGTSRTRIHVEMYDFSK